MNEPHQSPLSFILTSEEQTPAISLRGRDMVVTAGAGAGKTSTLVGRYLALLDEGLSPRRIAAITFTRKAAREMRNRVRQAIADYLKAQQRATPAAQRWEKLQADLDAARIGTIHELCAQILRTHPAETGIDPRFVMLEEGNAAWLRNEVVVDSLAWAVEQAGLHPLFQTIGAAPLHRYLSDLLVQPPGDFPEPIPGPEQLARWEQQLRTAQEEAAEAFLAHTEVTGLHAELAAMAPDDRADKLAQQWALALDAFAAAGTAGPRWEALALLDGINLRGGSQKAWPSGGEEKQRVVELLRSLRDLWQTGPGTLPATCTEADRILADLQEPLHLLVSHAASLYAMRKHDRESLDFNDLETMALALLLEHEAVRLFWQQQFDALLVDEYQDTNERQRQLTNALGGGRGNLFIVGDGKQSIYRFRGADVAVFRDEHRRILDGGGAAHELSTSYRTHAQLLQALNTLLPAVMDSSSAGEPWRVPFSPLQHHRDAPRQGLSGPFVELELAVGKKEEALPRAAAACAARIASLVAEREGLRFQDFAILCRSSGSFAYYEDALEAQGVPYQTIAGRGFYERPEIRDLLNALQAIVDPSDDLALFGFLRSPVIGFDDVSLYLLRSRQLSEALPTLWSALQLETVAEARRAVEMLAALRRLAGRLDTATLLHRFLEQSDYVAALQQAGEARAARNVAKLLADAQQLGLVQVHDFLTYVRDVAQQVRASEARATVEDAVQIMSIHQAKGLEFPVVVVGDINHQGGRGGRDLLVDPQLGVLFKPGTAEEPAIQRLVKQREQRQERAESDRIFYVAATRARDKLFLNGNVGLSNGRPKADGWLRQLLPPLGLDTGLDWETASAGAATMPTRLPAVSCIVYGDGYKPPAQAAAAKTATPVPAERRQLALLEPIPALPGVAGPEPAIVWQVVPAVERPSAPAWVVGTLVHEALAAWRFPQHAADPGFAAWSRARAQSLGLGDEERLDDAARSAARLLLRFRQHPLYVRLDGARRLAEVPYAYFDAQTPVEGTIDQLVEDGEGWQLVEFKTDRVIDLATFDRLSEYEDQVRCDARAVQSLAGFTPRCTICWLNYRGQVLEHPVGVC